MLKNKSKLIIAIITILLLVSTISFATTDVAAPEENTVSTAPSENSTDSESTIESDIRDRDLYLFDNNIVMDQLVDGNVFLFGNNIEITGKVNGSLYVFGNKVTFKQGSYVVQSIYACANEINFEGDSNDFYAACKTLNMAYDSFVVRDLRITAKDFTYSGGVGRNAYVAADNFIFNTEDENDGVVFGDLNYLSKSKLDLSKEFVQGNLNYTELKSDTTATSVSDIIIEKIIDLLTLIFTTIIVYLLIWWLAPKFAEKASSFVSVKAFSSFGIGLLALIIVPIVSIFLICSTVGAPIAFVVLGLYVSLLIISTAIVCTCITDKIKEKFNFDKKYKTILTLVGSSIVFWLLKQIPYIGGLISLILCATATGIIIMYFFTKFKKTKSSESKVEKTTDTDK